MLQTGGGRGARGGETEDQQHEQTCAVHDAFQLAESGDLGANWLRHHNIPLRVIGRPDDPPISILTMLR